MRFCLVVASALLALLLCEAALRVLFPKYRGVAEGQLQPDDMRIFAPPPNIRAWGVHPDTGRDYPFHTNNLGLRQHRDFSDADILSTTTVGVFGDSFVRGDYFDAPYAFTEPLDYLLNLDGDFTVLNFGVIGYGPAQSYFTYRSFHAREALDYVLFVYFGGNDLYDLVGHRLFDLDEDGRLRQREARGSAWWVPFASRLHLTYLTLDATGRLAPYIAGLVEETREWHPHEFVSRDVFGAAPSVAPVFDDGLEVFRQLIARWRAEVEESGGRFFVVILPTQPDYPRVRPVLEEANIGVVDLNACYARRDEGHRERAWQESPYRFENDWHWNELGNRLAAVCLDERLRREAGLPAMADAARDAALATYYAAFADSPFAEGSAIRRKYQALALFEEGPESYLAPDKLVVDSDHYDVYVDDEWFVFVNDDCHADDATERLFAHATPVDASHLAPEASYFSLRARFPPQKEGRCVATWAASHRLPLYEAHRFPISHVLVGQRDGAKAMLWSGEIVLDRAAFEKTLAAMLAAAGEPVIESGMDVHVHGRRVFYVSDDCEGTDGRTPFFLHVVPMREADLPPQRIEHGYDNLDFHQVGVTMGERCVVRWQLPDYPIRRIRTGQYVAVRDGGDGEQPRLRLLLPKYRDVAQGRLQPDDMRIFASLPNTRDYRVNPATKRPHPFHTNNLGQRQHRNFSDADILAATTVGVFGDSFVRAGYLDAPYVFTEPLDYLLNRDGDFAVLNFGMGDYGPAQSYFTYRSFHAREALDYVLFVYCANDIADLVRNRLFDLDDGGRLRQREVRGAAWWVPFVSRLHLTYLALDASGRLAPYLASAAEELGHYSAYWFSTPPGVPEHRLDHGAEVFRQLVRRWRDEVEGGGGRFLVALLPTQPDYPRVRPVLEEAGIGVIDLNACYARRDEGHLERDWEESPYYLHNDGHWNELGNRLAAACLDERLRQEAGLPAMTEAARDAALAKYYAAFESPRRESALERIRGKYQAFGRFDVVHSHAASSPSYKQAVESDYYDVYVDGESFVFANDDCDAQDATENLLAHATPADPGILPPDTSYFSLRPAIPPLQEEAVCFARWAMPQFAVSHVLVGQRDSAKTVLWSGEIVLDRAAFEKTLAAMLAAAGEPVIESGMDVHVHGRRIFYVSDDCEGTDGRTPFFLHVVPMRAADLPPQRIEHGYDNLDFHQAGATFGERCVVRWQLPDYPIRRIRTGQYVQHVEAREGEQPRLHRLWEGEADLGG